MLDVHSRQNTNLLFVTLFLLSNLLLTSACTRSSDANNTVVTLALPSSKNASNKIGTLSENPAHIVINISGNGMSPVYYQWDGHDGAAAAPSISISVPQGPARLIQVLYVTQDALQNLFFYYNDVTQDLTSANVGVAITVNSIGSATTQGTLAGRYLNIGGVTGPTGVLNTIYKPSNGKPAMIVDRNEIFGGWFQAFALPSNGFSYQLDDGRVLLSNYDASSANATDASRALVVLPSHTRIGGGSDILPRSENALNLLMGFFGPGAGGKSLCLNGSSGAPIPQLYTDASSFVPLTWNASASAASTCTSSQACYVSGGDKTGTSANCASPNSVTGLQFYETLLSSKDSLLLFRGPFKMTLSGNGANALSAAPSGATVSLTWAYMDHAADELDGVEIFYQWQPPSSSNDNSPYRKNNGYACNELTKKYGFSSAGVVAAPTNNKVINVGSGGANPRLEIIVCPYSKARSPSYFTSALEWNNGFSNGPSPSNSIGTRFVMASSSVSTDVVTAATCSVPGCSVSISSVNPGFKGSATISGNNIIYTASSNSGPDTISYVLSDGKGNTTVAYLNINVMTAYTWTGGYFTSNWTDASNWCGTVNPGHTGCNGAGNTPSTADTVVFDATCSGAYCSPTINVAPSITDFRIATGYPGVITQGAFLITLNGGFYQSGGSFVGSPSGISMSGDFIHQGGSFSSPGTLTFQFSGNSNISVSSGFSLTGSIAMTKSVPPLNLQSDLSVPSMTISSGGTVYLGSSKLTATGLTMGGGSTIHLGAGSLTVGGAGIPTGPYSSGTIAP